MDKLKPEVEERVDKAIENAFWYYDSPESFAEAFDCGDLHNKVLEILAQEIRTAEIETARKFANLVIVDSSGTAKRVLDLANQIIGNES